MKIRIKQDGKFTDVDISFRELTAGELTDIISSDEDDMMIYKLAHLMVTDTNDQQLFSSPEDVKARLSARSLKPLSDALLFESGLSDDSIDNTKKN